MKLFLAGLLAAGLPVVDGRPSAVQRGRQLWPVGGESLVMATGEAATRDTGADWRVVLAGQGGLDALRAGSRMKPAVEHPVLHVEGAGPSAVTRRIVTGRPSVRFVLGVAGAAALAGDVARDHGLVDEGVGRRGRAVAVVSCRPAVAGAGGDRGVAGRPAGGRGRGGAGAADGAARTAG